VQSEDSLVNGQHDERFASAVRAFFAAVLAVLVISGCGREAPWPSAGVFTGYYSKAFEQSDFRPTGSKEIWWLTIDQAMKDPAPVGRCIYLVVRGTLTPRGSYGHLGKYDRQLSAQEVMQAQTPGPDERAGLPSC
jgi:hypothetical protein